MKKRGTLSPGLGASDTTLKMPASASGFTSIDRFQAAVALGLAGAGATLGLIWTGCDGALLGEA